MHRVIVGKPYYEPQGIPPERTVEAVFAFLLRKKVPRQTEGATRGTLGTLRPLCCMPGAARVCVLGACCGGAAPAPKQCWPRALGEAGDNEAINTGHAGFKRFT